MNDELAKAVQGLVDGLQDVAKSSELAAVALNQMSEFIGKIQGQIGSLVALYNPASFDRFKLAADDASAALGAVFVPILDRFRLVVSGLGDLVASLTPNAKAMVAGLAAAGVGMATVTAAAFAFSTLINSAFAGIPAILGAIASGVAGMTFALKDFDDIQKILTAVLSAASRVIADLGDVMVSLVRAVAPLVDVALVALTNSLRLFGDLVRAVAPAIASVAEIAAKVLLPLLGPLGRSLEVVGAAVAAVVGALQPMAAAMSVVLDVVIEIWQIVLGPFVAAWDDAKAAAANLFTELGRLGQSIGAVIRAVGKLANELFAGLAPALTQVVGLITGPLRLGLQILTAGLQALADVLKVINDVVLGSRLQDPFKEGASAGLALRSVQTNSASGILSKAQQSAFGLGKNADPAKETAQNTQSMAQSLADMAGDIRAIKVKLVDQAGGAAAAGIAPGATILDRIFRNMVPGS